MTRDAIIAVLVRHGVVSAGAIDDAENYDGEATLGQVKSVAAEIAAEFSNLEARLEIAAEALVWVDDNCLNCGAARRALDKIKALEKQ